MEEPEYCSRLSGIGWEGVDGIQLAQDWGLVARSCGKKKKKVKCTLVQALRLCTGCTAYRESRGTALPFHDHGIRSG